MSVRTHHRPAPPAERALWALASAVCLLVAAAPRAPGQGAPARYTITDLGSLGDTSFSRARGINNSGQVVGEANTDQTDDNGDPITHAFLWQNGAIHDLGTLGGNTSEARAVNDHGQAVGYADTDQTDDNGDTLSDAVMWQNGKIHDLGRPNGSIFGYGLSVNSSGAVAGFAEDADGNRTAFLWQNGKMQNLGTLPGGSTSEAEG